uniref:Uncharacterized protein n=1 Tax=Pyxicephalus adspersus TaxID=30357 RepID=A0AAV3B739_PYXAD|nr:TPA: hypothetical protein GDO54_001338 [Pyxicephalus adspersus]
MSMQKSNLNRWIYLHLLLVLVVHWFGECQTFKASLGSQFIAALDCISFCSNGNLCGEKCGFAIVPMGTANSQVPFSFSAI